MGRLKREMRKIHERKLRKAREQVRLFIAGKVKADALNALARRILHKRLNAGSQLPNRMVKPGQPGAQQVSGGVA